MAYRQSERRVYLIMSISVRLVDDAIKYEVRDAYKSPFLTNLALG